MLMACPYLFRNDAKTPLLRQLADGISPGGGEKTQKKAP